MTQEEIKQGIKELKKQIRLAEHDLEILKMKRKYWEAQCEHPNKYKYSAQGEIGDYCPDCEYQT